MYLKHLFLFLMKMDKLFNFIDYMCIKYSIDESHGLKHAKGTVVKAISILRTLPNISEEESRVTIYASALHDTCDSKYTDVTIASQEIREWLFENKWIEEEINAVIGIITTMSYSKLKASMIDGKPVYPDHGKWQRAYDVARHADLLEAYNVARCYLYNLHIHPRQTEEEHWNAVIQLFNIRIFRYVKDGWITLPGALQFVPVLEYKARNNIKKRLTYWPDVSL